LEPDLDARVGQLQGFGQFVGILGAQVVGLLVGTLQGLQLLRGEGDAGQATGSPLAGPLWRRASAAWADDSGCTAANRKQESYPPPKLEEILEAPWGNTLLGHTLVGHTDGRPSCHAVAAGHPKRHWCPHICRRLGSKYTRC